jgi:hypothetical protein
MESSSGCELKNITVTVTLRYRVKTKFSAITPPPEKQTQTTPPPPQTLCQKNKNKTKKEHFCYTQGRPLGGASVVLVPGAELEGAPKRQSPTGHTLIRITVAW